MNKNNCDKNLFRYTEKCLHEYVQNCAKLERLKGDLVLLRSATDVKAQSYDIAPTSSSASDPVFAFFISVENLEWKIKMLERITEPVKKFMADLAQNRDRKNSMFMTILKLYYFDNYSVEAVMQELHICRAAFFNQKKSFVRQAMSYFGF